ncbi:MAG: MOSC domain-containing protein [Haloferacaceae archaeon]
MTANDGGETGDRTRRAPDGGTASGRVVGIHVAPSAGEDMAARDRVEAVAGRGLRGDRYFAETGTYTDSARDVPRDVTLIERETLAALERDYDIDLPPGAHRRNVTTEGIALNHLVGDRVRLGDAVVEITELCEPCSYLQELLGVADLYDALRHRGGLRGRIVEDGTVAVGDPVTPMEDADAAIPRDERG